MNIMGSYNYPLVALSVFIAMFASYAALDLAGRVTAASGWARWAWLTGGACAMGFGIWSMHYVGMLAFHMPIPVRYDWPTVLLSLLAAILASAVALFVVSRQEMDAADALAGSVIMGAGIAAMHYIGMAAMRLAAECRYDLRLVTLSVVFAILTSLVALMLAFRFRKERKGTGWVKIGAAMLLGAAIPVMHYTGMAAARFLPSAMPPDMSHAVSVSSLAMVGIVIVTLFVLGLAVITSAVDRRFSAQTLKLESSEKRYRRLFERNLAGVYCATLDGRIVDCNDAFSRILGYGSRGEFLSEPGQDIYLSPADREAYLEVIVEQRALSNFERCLRRRDGTRLWVLESATLTEGTDGTPSLVEATLIDITERKRAETELRQAHALLEARQREIEEELQLAARVQQSLAPRSLTWGSIAVEAFYEPVRTIGGDFGLVIPRVDDLSLLVCDVSGHGISSALVANRIYTETRAQIEQGAGLGPMIQHLNRFVMQDLGSAQFYFTMAAARLNRAGNGLEFGGAGHPPAMIVQPGAEPRLLESQSAVLGLLGNAVNGNATTDVPTQAGDRMVIYTDGFTESFNAHEEMLGIEGFKQIVRESAMLPLPNMKQEIIDRVAAWRGGPATDDLSLVVVEIQ